MPFSLFTAEGGVDRFFEEKVRQSKDLQGNASGKSDFEEFNTSFQYVSPAEYKQLLLMSDTEQLFQLQMFPLPFLLRRPYNQSTKQQQKTTIKLF